MSHCLDLSNGSSSGVTCICKRAANTRCIISISQAALSSVQHHSMLAMSAEVAYACQCRAQKGRSWSDSAYVHPMCQVAALSHMSPLQHKLAPCHVQEVEPAQSMETQSAARHGKCKTKVYLQLSRATCLVYSALSSLICCVLYINTCLCYV